MIHIQIQTQPPREWIEKADRLTRQIIDLGYCEEMFALIEINKQVWRELEEWLKEQSHGKCWYSESKDHVSYWHVDHFRPRSEVKDLEGNTFDGYWWLAFNWQNFRLSGSAINVPKSSFFPLREGTNWAEGPEDDIDDEHPYLLDPVKQEDPCLLSFDNTGNARSSSDNQWFAERAEISIKILNLNNFPSLVRARRSLWEKCERHLNNAIYLFNEVANTYSTSKKMKLQLELQTLKNMVKRDAEFSAVACVCIRAAANEYINRAIFG